MHSLGLHVEGEALKVARLRRVKNKIEVESLQTLSQDVNPFYTEDTVLVTGLNPSEILIRELTLQLKTKRAVRAALPFQLDSLLPYSQEEQIAIPFIQQQGESHFHISILAAARSSVQSHLRTLESFRIDPDVISCTPVALAKWAALHYKESSYFFYHLGKKESFCGSVVNRHVRKSHSLKLGLDDFLAALEKDKAELCAKELDLTQLDKGAFPHLCGLVDQFCRQIDRAFLFLKKDLAPEELSSPLLLSGEISTLFNFYSLFEQMGPLLPLVQESPYAIAIGLALEGLDEKTRIQFRQGALLPKKHFIKRIKQLRNYSLLGAACMLLLSLSHILFIKKKEAVLVKRLDSYMGSSSSGSLQTRLDSWDKAMRSDKKAFPYLLTAPTVSDTLAWLSTHPVLKCAETQEQIDIKSVNYSLTKHPKPGHSSLPYQARVELEFTATSAKIARLFHEALLAGDAFVDAKQAPTWDVQNNVYKTGFFLK